MEKIKSDNQLKTEAKHAEVKRLWKSLWYRGALRTVIAEAVAHQYNGKMSYSTVLRIVGGAKKNGGRASCK